MGVHNDYDDSETDYSSSRPTSLSSITSYSSCSSCSPSPTSPDTPTRIYKLSSGRRVRYTSHAQQRVVVHQPPRSRLAALLYAIRALLSRVLFRRPCLKPLLLPQHLSRTKPKPPLYAYIIAVILAITSALSSSKSAVARPRAPGMKPLILPAQLTTPCQSRTAKSRRGTPKSRLISRLDMLMCRVVMIERVFCELCESAGVCRLR